MIPLQVNLDLDKNPWRDLAEATKSSGMGNIERIGRLTNGTTSGKSTVAIIVQMPDGKRYMAETTMTLFLTAANAMRIREEQG